MNLPVIRLAALAAALLLATAAARAQDAPSPEMLHAALQAAVAQRNQALNDGVQMVAQLTLARREIARLQKDLSEANKAGSTPAAPAPRE